MSNNEKSDGTNKVPSSASSCDVCLSRLFRALCTNLGISSLLIGYTLLGAFMFFALEKETQAPNPVTPPLAPESVPITEQEFDARRDLVERLWDMTESLNILYKDNWTRLATEEVLRFQLHTIHETTGTETPTASRTIHREQWTFSKAFLYALSIITSIGYNHVTIRSDWGKIVTMLYALIGLPLMLLYLAMVGALLARGLRFVYARVSGASPSIPSYEEELLPPHYHTSASPYFLPDHAPVRESCSAETDSLDLLVKGHSHPMPLKSHTTAATPSSLIFWRSVLLPVALSVCVLMAWILFGTSMLMYMEQWSFLDALFFSFMTLATIGFGDLVPGGDHEGAVGSDVRLLFVAFYLLTGMALTSMLFNLILDQCVAHAQRRSVSWIASYSTSCSSSFPHHKEHQTALS